MPWPWRKNQQDELTAAASRAAASAAAAADDARRSAERAAVAAEAIVELMRRDRPSGRSVIAVVVATLALLGGGCWILLVGSYGLRPPLGGGSGRYGDVRISIEDSGAEQLPRIGVVHHVDPDFGGSHRYQLTFRASDAGQRFALLFHSTAILEGLRGTVDFEEAMIDCPTSLQGSLTEERCQLVTATVPDADSDEPWSTRLPCNWTEDAGLTGGITVELSGSADVTTSVDWAHERIELPSLFASSVAEAELPFDPATAISQTCRYLSKPTNKIVSDYFEPPQGESPRMLSWRTESGGSLNNMLATDADAESTANLLLAVGGVLAGVGIGMMSVSFRRIQAWLSTPDPRASVPGEGG